MWVFPLRIGFPGQIDIGKKRNFVITVGYIIVYKIRAKPKSIFNPDFFNQEGGVAKQQFFSPKKVFIFKIYLAFCYFKYVFRGIGSV